MLTCRFLFVHTDPREMQQLLSRIQLRRIRKHLEVARQVRADRRDSIPIEVIIENALVVKMSAPLARAKSFRAREVIAHLGSRNEKKRS